jgi:hypothetical protein
MHKVHGESSTGTHSGSKADSQVRHQGFQAHIPAKMTMLQTALLPVLMLIMLVTFR